MNTKTIPKLRRKIISIASILVAVSIFFSVGMSGNKVQAVDNCTDAKYNFKIIEAPSGSIRPDEKNDLTVKISGVKPNTNFNIGIGLSLHRSKSDGSGVVEFHFKHSGVNLTKKIYLNWLDGSKQQKCIVSKYSVAGDTPVCNASNFVVTQGRGGNMCYTAGNNSGACFDNGAEIQVYLVNIKNKSGNLYNGGDARISRCGAHGNCSIESVPMSILNGKTGVFTAPPLEGGKRFRFKLKFNGTRKCESSLFTVSENCTNSQCMDQATAEDSAGDIQVPYEICRQLPPGDAHDKCIECAGGDIDNAGVWTAVGCIKREPEAMIANIIKIGLITGGGVALLSILAAGFIFTTSTGDAKKIEQAKELITNSIIGLIFIIFSIAILQFIGYRVLRIPGFGGP